MKTSIRTIAIALALAPAAAFAQSSVQPPEGHTASKVDYPGDMQGNPSRAGGQNDMKMQSDGGYGGVTSGTMQSGSTHSIMPHNTWRSMYGHH